LTFGTPHLLHDTFDIQRLTYPSHRFVGGGLGLPDVTGANLALTEDTLDATYGTNKVLTAGRLGKVDYVL
jgi:hypothetical protein